MRKTLIALLSCALAFNLASCGTFVPPLTDFPDPTAATESASESRMIGQIVRAVRCQLGASITATILNDWRLAEDRLSKKRYSDAFDNWGAEANITITITDKTGLSPSTLLTPPTLSSPIFNFAAGIDASSEAYRSVKFNTFYTMRELFNRPCPVDDRKFGSPLVATDLRITPLLEGRLLAIRTGEASPLDEPGRTNVLSHSVRFTVDTSAGANPSWKFIDVAVNPSGNLFTTSRNRIHELIITFGPLDRNRGGKSLILIAEQTHIYAISQQNIQSVRPLVRPLF